MIEFGIYIRIYYVQYIVGDKYLVTYTPCNKDIYTIR